MDSARRVPRPRARATAASATPAYTPTPWRAIRSAASTSHQHPAIAATSSAMAANTHGRPDAVAHDPERKPYGRAARRPVEAREPISLPVLTEAGSVLEVVGPEVHDRRARAARGPGGKGDGSESEDGQQGA